METVTNISKLEANTKVVNLVGVITTLSEPKVTATGVNYQEGVISDKTGQVRLSLWDEQVDQFKVGDKILIATGWCKEFQGELQVSSGKFGKIIKGGK